MEWTPEADEALRKVPFFVRKKVRARVEKEAAEEGKTIVGIREVKATQKRYLSGMDKEIRGFQVDTCFGPSGCPNRAVADDDLPDRIEALLQQADLPGFLKEHVKGPIKFHHEFRISIADCPNACSQPQIKDIGIIGACVPRISDTQCTLCGACETACPDDAVCLDPDRGGPVIDRARCMACGKCINACPSGTIETATKGYRILMGGKLGRHPRLAREIPGIFSAAEVLEITAACIDFYKRHSRSGSRFAQILTDAHFKAFVERFGKKQP